MDPATGVRRHRQVLLALILLPAACGDDTAAQDGEARDSRDGEVVEVDPAESPTSLGPELTSGQPADFDGVVLTVEAITAGDAPPAVPTAEAVIEVDVAVENATDVESVAPGLSVLCGDPAAGVGVPHANEVLVEPIGPGDSVSGAVALDVPAGCGSPAVVITRLYGVDQSDNPLTAHVPVPSGALP